ncbi:MAG: UDP-N-acetylmuramate dehydrogenase [Phycisphaerales bacterium JB039]
MTGAAASTLVIERDAPISTWYRIGGRADRLARPATLDDLRHCLDLDADLRILGAGANLLVDDEGVGALVVSLAQGEFRDVVVDESGPDLVVGAGVDLRRLISDTTRMGLAGLERLGGIPATVGGAIRMNAGGAWGEIGDVIDSVRALRRDGDEVILSRPEIDFAYRASGLDDLLIVGARLRLRREDPGEIRRRLLRIMEAKGASQPMGQRSAGCAFRNPTLKADLDGVGRAGQRISAGLLIDRAGLKGLAVGGATVSAAHANFIVAEPGRARARDVIELMDLVRRRVADRFGVALEPEVVIWSRR